LKIKRENSSKRGANPGLDAKKPCGGKGWDQLRLEGEGGRQVGEKGRRKIGAPLSRGD